MKKAARPCVPTGHDKGPRALDLTARLVRRRAQAAWERSSLRPARVRDVTRTAMVSLGFDRLRGGSAGRPGNGEAEAAVTLIGSTAPGAWREDPSWSR